MAKNGRGPVRRSGPAEIRGPAPGPVRNSVRKEKKVRSGGPVRSGKQKGPEHLYY